MSQNLVLQVFLILIGNIILSIITYAIFHKRIFAQQSKISFSELYSNKRFTQIQEDANAVKMKNGQFIKNETLIEKIQEGCQIINQNGIVISEKEQENN